MWRREFRDKDLLLVLSGEEENKADDMALVGCGEESTKWKTYLLYVAEKKINKVDDIPLS